MLLLSGRTLSQETLSFATGEWPPYTSDNLPSHGFFSDFISEVVKDMGMKAEFKFYPWARTSQYVEEGKFFGAFPYAVTEERKQKFDFSDIINVTTTVLFYSEKHFSDGIKFEALSDLDDYKFVAVRGSKAGQDLIDEGFDVHEVTNDQQSIRMLTLGRADLTSINELVGWFIINKLYPEGKILFSTVVKPLHSAETAVMISRKYPNSDQLGQRFNQALKRVKEKGVYQDLLKKHGLKER